MRVLHVVDSAHEGDASVVILEHVRHAGPEIESFVVDVHDGGSALELASAWGAHTAALGTRKPNACAVSPGGIARLAMFMRRERITVVNGHGAAGGLCATAAGAWARVPVIVRTEHAVHYPGRSSAMCLALESLATRATHRVVCVCEAVRLSHVVRMPWAGDRFVTILNGISAAARARPRSATRADLGLLDSDRMVLAAGKLELPSAHHVLIEAFHRVSRRSSAVRLFIAGDGGRRDELERQVRDLGLADRVRFLGARGAVADLLEASDVFVVPSLREGLSMPLLEAMRTGCPVVATRIGGNPEALVDGETGWIVPPNDAGPMAEALLNLLADRARARAFAAAGRDRWARAFTGERMVAETERLYRSELAAVRDLVARRARIATPREWSDAAEGSG